MLLLASYFASYYRRKLAFDHVIRQTEGYARPEDQSETHLIAHSLGTFLMGTALRKRAEFHLGRIVLVGCVLPRSFAWTKLTGIGNCEYRFMDVRNEVGRRDIVVWSAWLMSWLIRGLGVAGLRGFKGLTNLVHTLTTTDLCQLCSTGTARIHNIRSQHMGHSDAFVGSGYAEVFWLPYLWNIPPREYQEFLLLCKAAAGLERPWSAKARAAGIIDPRLVAVEKKLLAANWTWSNGSFANYVLQEVKSKKAGTDQELKELTELAIRGTWESVALAVETRLMRQERSKEYLASRTKSFWTKIGLGWRRHRAFSQEDLVYDSTKDEPIRCLDPREAVRRAIERLP
jgi:pimeloyl-ACP methyl ester carboxylesterase